MEIKKGFISNLFQCPQKKRFSGHRKRDRDKEKERERERR
jgi:hypothetical protein